VYAINAVNITVFLLKHYLMFLLTMHILILENKFLEILVKIIFFVDDASYSRFLSFLFFCSLIIFVGWCKRRNTFVLSMKCYMTRIQINLLFKNFKQSGEKRKQFKCFISLDYHEIIKKKESEIVNIYRDKQIDTSS
jgi:hypothetical protein